MTPLVMLRAIGLALGTWRGTEKMLHAKITLRGLDRKNVATFGGSKIEQCFHDESAPPATFVTDKRLVVTDIKRFSPVSLAPFLAACRQGETLQKPELPLSPFHDRLRILFRSFASRLVRDI
jgi:hypothetical protein